MSADLSLSRHADAWTYYDFGARSFEDEIRALVFDDLDQAVDHLAIGAYLDKQPTGSTFPVVTIEAHTVPLGSESSDPSSVCRMTKLMLPIDLDEYHDALAYLSQRPELLAKFRQTISRHMAQRILSQFLDAVLHKDRITLETADRKVIYASGPDR